MKHIVGINIGYFFADLRGSSMRVLADRKHGRKLQTHNVFPVIIPQIGFVVDELYYSMSILEWPSQVSNQRKIRGVLLEMGMGTEIGVLA